MTKLQKRILDVMNLNEKLTTKEITDRLNNKYPHVGGLSSFPRYTPRSVSNSIQYLRGDGYVTDGCPAAVYANGKCTWKTPKKYVFTFYDSNDPIRWMKLPKRFAASPPNVIGGRDRDPNVRRGIASN